MFAFSTFSLLALITAGHVHAHVSVFHPSMYGFNVTDKTFPYDNRPVAPLVDLIFDKWWFHGHLGHPPNPGDFFELPAGKPATAELACNKGATSHFKSSEGGDIRQGNNPCPNSPLSAIHTTGFNDLTGCALAIAYKSDVTTIQPEDFTVFSVNQTCVWTRFTDFQVPANMPPCPQGGCHCAWFWIHSSDSGSQQNYMTGLKCNVTGSTSTVPLAKPKVPRRCGADPANHVMNPTPGNCTYGAKNPFYWFQKERNNMNEGTYSPPAYNDLYNFRDGAQNDIFENSYDSIPVPSPNQTAIPKLKTSPGDTGMPVSSSISPSVSHGSVVSSSTPGYVYPTPSPSSSSVSSPPPVTVTNTVFITILTNALPTSTRHPNPSSSTGSPIPSPSNNPSNPSVIILNKRKPM
ncbi:hypothetical protein BDM02DRAFT_2013047 [Thelephora ganbajun]|uniref:Uncharacterized protein n=1 Tax=Thelephora ganbajun TaxID=370292 RepID=A0ACB6ZH71_THEGA|nr:hypothetical protein BDM02DRAFT_2013047 [Thelephora ganbajun]